ncbi:keratin-associated protein 5-4 [Drosophila novamexicana]|uniref:keratin-associated protein 5-4 n=1 Tax=Drosophila novamexicana TaxID=47314 RepID=UPI0011E60607|nr:keratin-associated protein 5-4 [Drosophila novamexicana]
MRSRRVCILIATLIAIGQFGCQALNCTTTGSATPTICGEGVTQCFAKSDDSGTVTRGCVTDATCPSANCLTCTTDNCNANLVCKQCDGTQPQCATSQTATGTSLQLCSTGSQQCLNQLADNGTLTRGCGECAAGVGNCSPCNTDNCNVGIYPADRRLCYQCDGANCQTLDNATVLMPCGIYQAEAQKCYMIGTSATAMQRGCQNDAAAGNKCAGATPDASCVFCDTENGCNNRPYESVLGSCIKCSDNSTCANSQAADKAVACPASVYTETEVSCYTKTGDDGTVSRGCTNELTEACTTTTNCESCSGTGCNIQAAGFGCLICRSDNYAPCRSAQVGIELCPVASQTGEDAKKCFNGEWNGVVVRGCLADATPLMKFQCTSADDSRCETCDTKGCNIKTYNGAATLQHMGLGLFGLIFVMSKYL